MQTIKVNIDYKGKPKDFAFKAESSILDDQRIKSEMAFLSGGLDKMLEFDNIMLEAYSKHIEVNREAFGEEEARRIEKEIKEKPLEELTEEEIQALRRYRSNRHYLKYIQMEQEKTKLYSYSWLKVMCISPKDFPFFEEEEPFLDNLLKEVEKELAFFRKEKEKS
ncbi:MAG TPA: hypothetical protein VHO03_16975 [Ignavibacteriales bacterium]|nr:hypothetical protein [Ignavibacteriales bacterium]